MRRVLTRGAMTLAVAATLLSGVSGTAQATSSSADLEPETGIQNCWIGGSTYVGVKGGEIEVKSCYEIQQDEEGYKVATIVRVRREYGTPAPVTVNTRIEGGEDESSTTQTVDVSDTIGWAVVRSPWNRSSGVYNGYGFAFADGMVSSPMELHFMHNSEVWL